MKKCPLPCPCKPSQINSVGYKTKDEDITVGGEFVRKDRRFSRRRGGGEKVMGGERDQSTFYAYVELYKKRTEGFL